jgi:hypothetical protein
LKETLTSADPAIQKRSRIGVSFVRVSQALKRAFDELRVGMSENDVGRLLWWYDDDASDTVAYKKIVKDAFGADMGRSQNSALGGSQSLPALAGADNTMLTARSKRQTIMSEKSRIERRLKELQMKEGKLKAP